MRIIRNLEIHVAHGCNFTCESCSHYSNQGHKGMLSLDEACNSMSLWNRRISPKVITLLGGEPTIHPQLPDFLLLAREHWPDAELQLVTNGSFLHRHPSLPVVLQNDRKASIYLTVHHDAAEYVERLRPATVLLKKWIREYGIQGHFRDSFKNWTRRYKGHGSAMEPYDDRQPRQSWETCPARYAAQLFEGKIWKCGPLAYLKLQDAKYQLSEKWEPYLRYRPLDPGCTDQQLAEFFDREEESFCGMCPANPEKFALPLPIRSHSPSAPRHDAAPVVRASGTRSAGTEGLSEKSIATTHRLQRSDVWQLGLPLAANKQTGWRPYPIFRAPTHHLRDLSCHVSVLTPGTTPHPPHRHIEEEILIMLSGEADLVIPNARPGLASKLYRLRPGRFVYYPAFQPHTLRNPGPHNATYLMFKWRAGLAKNVNELGARIVRYQGLPMEGGKGGFRPRRIMEGGTRHLRKMHCHVTTLQPGAGYPAHSDPYDVAILVLEGTVKTLDRHVGPHSLVFYASGEPHGMKNVGTVPAVYLVFEFHGHQQNLRSEEQVRRVIPALATSV